MRTKSEGGTGAGDLDSVGMWIGHDDASRGRSILRGFQSVVGGLAVDLKKEAWRELRLMEGWAT
jgi:hypothetical protein